MDAVAPALMGKVQLHCLAKRPLCYISTQICDEERTVESKADLVAPARMAMATPCMISGASGPTMCTPSTCTTERRCPVDSELGWWELPSQVAASYPARLAPTSTCPAPTQNAAS